MRQNLLLVVALGALLFLVASGGPVAAQGPTPQHADPLWQASYWNNKYMNGDPALQRSESEINYDWGGGAPGPGVEDEGFSARWTRYLDLPADTYTFTAVSDDGMRVSIDGTRVLDKWFDQPPTTYTFERALPAGHHLFVVEYFENADRAVAKFHWSPDPATPVTHWDAAFYNNKTLSGAPVLTRDDTMIDFHWGEASPAAGLVNADDFSVRWFRYLDAPAGTYRFTTTMDDGMRLWVNDHLLLDDWSDQYVNTHTMDFYLPGGRVPITLEYYEHTGGAFAELSWAPISATSTWKGEYYNNVNLSGDPALIRYDDAVFFNWGTGSPSGEVNSNAFSARWTRSLDLAAGTYQFWVAADDGVRLWVNNHLLIDQWRDQSVTTYGGEIYVPGGGVPVRVEYYERGGNAICNLSWNLKEAAPQPSGEVIVDDGEAGFRPGGLNSGWVALGRGFGGHLWWSWNNDRVRTGYQWARWYPDLAATRYEVFAHIPANLGTTTNARYWVSHADGYTLRTVNQNSAIPRWASLGMYWFRGTSADYVSLSDVTYEGYATKRVVFDAIKWEPR